MKTSESQPVDHSPAGAEVNPIRKAEADGYRHGVPPWSPGVREIDAPIAQHDPCDACGGRMLYVAMHHPARRSYKAFAVCTSCGAALEF